MLNSANVAEYKGYCGIGIRTPGNLDDPVGLNRSFITAYKVIYWCKIYKLGIGGLLS